MTGGSDRVSPVMIHLSIEFDPQTPSLMKRLAESDENGILLSR